MHPVEAAGEKHLERFFAVLSCSPGNPMTLTGNMCERTLNLRNASTAGRSGASSSGLRMRC